MRRSLQAEAGRTDLQVLTKRQVCETWGQSSDIQLLCSQGSWDWWYRLLRDWLVFPPPHRHRNTLPPWSTAQSSDDKWENNNFCFIVGDQDKSLSKHPGGSIWQEQHDEGKRWGLTCIWRHFLSAGLRHCRKGWFHEGRPLTWLSGVFFHWLWPGKKGKRQTNTWVCERKKAKADQLVSFCKSQLRIICF